MFEISNNAEFWARYEMHLNRIEPDMGYLQGAPLYSDRMVADWIADARKLEDGCCDDG